MSHIDASPSKEVDANTESHIGFTSVPVMQSVCAKLYECVAIKLSTSQTLILQQI